jgi:hypothetical protein
MISPRPNVAGRGRRKAVDWSRLDRRKPHFLRRRHLLVLAESRVMPRLRRCSSPTRFISRGCATHRGSALLEPPTVNRFAHLLGRPVVDSRPARDSSLPGKVRGRIPSRPRQRMRPPGGVLPPRAARLRDGSHPSPLSSRLFVPGTTRGHADEPATALQHARPTGVGSYLRDTPGLRLLKHEVDQNPAPVTTPAAAGLPRLVMDVPRSVPSLAGVTPRAPHRMSRAPARA